MDNKLRFDLTVKEHPYSHQNGSELEKWGYISISILAESRKIVLIETEWDLYALIKWVTNNQIFLQNTTLSINGKIESFQHESLAQALKRLQERDFPEEEDDAEYEWFSQLYDFRQYHALRFAMRGSKIPDIIIGCNNGVGEISLSTDENDWSYSFDMDEFLNEFQKNLDL